MANPPGRIVVNVHYFADSLEAHLKSRARDFDVVISDERDELLETGGGLMKAKALLRDDPFLCVNTDNFWVDGPVDGIRLLASQWDDDRMDALMLLVPLARAHNHSGRGDFQMDPWGRLSRRKPGRMAPYVWTGIQMLSQRLLVDPPATAYPSGQADTARGCKLRQFGKSETDCGKHGTRRAPIHAEKIRRESGSQEDDCRTTGDFAGDLVQ